jgi:L-lactate dehydrogenase complex protein LldG
MVACRATQRPVNDRDTILRRIRQAVGDDAPESYEDTARTYRRTNPDSLEERVAEFAQRVTEYHATVLRVAAHELSDAIASACYNRSVRSLVVPHDIPPNWLPDGVETLRDGPVERLSNEQLDHSDGVLTGCAVGIAQTGTIVLDGGPVQGRRVITLLPDYHLCVIREDQIMGLVPEALAYLLSAKNGKPRPVTFVSGPSATSDIELNRIEGVHGPRTLEVLVVA